MRKLISSGARKDNSFGYDDNAIHNEKVFKPIATDNLGEEHIYFEIDTDVVPCCK